MNTENDTNSERSTVPDKETDAIEYRLTRKDIPEDGYRRAARKLHATLSESTPGSKVTTSWLKLGRNGRRILYVCFALLFAVPLIGVIQVIEAYTPIPTPYGLVYGRFAAGPEFMSTVNHYFGIFVATVTIVATVACIIGLIGLLTRPILQQRHGSGMTLQLTTAGNNKFQAHAFTPDDDDRLLTDLHTLLESLDFPTALRRTSVSVSELLGLSETSLSSSDLHHMQLVTIDDKPRDYLIGERPEESPANTSNTQLPLDRIAALLANAETPMAVQIQIQPRAGDSKRQSERARDISHTRDGGAVRRVLRDFIGLAGEEDHLAEQQPDEKLSIQQQQRKEQLKRSCGYPSYGICVQAIAVDNKDTTEEIITGEFNAIVSCLDPVINQETTAHASISHPPAHHSSSIRRLLSRHDRRIECFASQTPYRSRWTRLSQKRHAVVVDEGATVWNYLMLSAQTLASTADAADATPRDETVTDPIGRERRDTLLGEDPAESINPSDD